MSVPYGSENPECFKSQHVKATPLTTRSNWRKLVLVSVGTVLSVGGALVMYEDWDSFSNRFVPSAINLASASTDMGLLNSGREIMIRVVGKNNLCMDDGGGHANGETNFVSQACDPNSPNQIFRYDNKTNNFRIANKPEMCLDDSGSMSSGSAPMHLWQCVPTHPNQQFVVEAATSMIRNPNKPNLCIDDGGGTAPGQTIYALTTCGSDTPNQRFEVVAPAAIAEELRKARAAAGTQTAFDLLNSGQEIMIRMKGKKNLCVDDGGGYSNGETNLVGQACDPYSPNQIFRYDAKTRNFRIANKPQMCWDDSGSTSSRSAPMHLWQCVVTHPNQQFVYEPETLLIRNPDKPNLCVDDGGGSTPGETTIALATCAAGSSSQSFEVVSPATMVAEQEKARVAAGTQATFELLNSGQEIMIRLKEKDNLCLDDGESYSNGDTKIVDQACDPYSPNQIFRYDPKTRNFRSANKPDMCLDDGGSSSSGSTLMTMWQCTVTHPNQQFVVELDTMLIRNPDKSTLCVDDGGASTPGETRYALATCSAGSKSQSFEIVSPAEVAAELGKARTAAGTQAPVDLLNSGQEVMIRIKGKDNVCLDDGGGQSNGASKITDNVCDPTSPNQVFMYDAKSHNFRNANKPNMCLDDGGSMSSASVPMTLWQCVPTHPNQQFVYEPETMMIRSPQKVNLCINDGGGATPGSAQFYLSTCGADSQNQLFEIVALSDMSASLIKPVNLAALQDPKQLLTSGAEIMLRVQGKNNLCMDDGGGRSNGQTKFADQTCDPNSPDQIFTYDAQARMFRSVHKPGMCLDDGGSSGPATTQMHLWQCVPDAPNQWFVVDADTMMIRNPAKPGLCIDDGGGTDPGQSRYSLNTCQSNNPDQSFEVVSAAVMDNELRTTRTAAGTQAAIDLLNSGQQVMLRVKGKNNLCMDDGGGHSNGETKFAGQTCDPTSPNQIYSYDSQARMFRNVNKPGMCLDDGGSSGPATTQMHLWQCVPDTPNQWFVVEPDTLQIRSPGKPGLCIDDGGENDPNESRYSLNTCQANNPNQQFEVVFPADIADQLRQARVSAGTQDKVDLLTSGQDIMLRARGKNLLCMDDGGGRNNAETVFAGLTCDPESLNQIFRYDHKAHMIRSVSKPGMCLNNGDASSMRLWQCTPNTPNQWFVVEPDTMLIHGMGKQNMCIADGGGITSAATPYTQATCDASSSDEQFQAVSPAAVAAMLKKAGTAAGTQNEIDLLNSGQDLMLRIQGQKSLCLDDGGGRNNAETTFTDATCDPNSPNQIFRYDVKARMFRSVNKPGMCFDSGNVNGIYLWQCVSNTANQWFVLDPQSKMLRSPGKPNLCVAQTGAAIPGVSVYSLPTCDLTAPNQRFEVVSPASVADALQKARATAGTQAAFDLLNSGQEVMLRVKGKNNLCMDDGGGHSNGETEFVDQTCDSNSPNQVFRYDPIARMFRSSNKPGMCLDDGGSSGSGTTNMHLWQCVPNTPNQWFVYEPDTLLIRSPKKANLCIDDGGAMSPGASRYSLKTCDANSANQQFEVVYVSGGSVPKDYGPQPQQFEMEGEVMAKEPVAEPELFLNEFMPGKKPVDWNEPAITVSQPAATESSPNQPQQNTQEGSSAVRMSAPNSEIGDLDELMEHSAEAPPGNIPVVANADTSFANYSGDWNLLAPSKETINLVNTANSPEVSAAQIFQYLQNVKDRADMEHNLMLYRYKRTFECASAGLQTLAKDSITMTEYDVLVRWMYEHCAAGSTEIKSTGSSLSSSETNDPDAAPLVEDNSSDVKRQYMTKTEFYYEIKNHFTQQNDKILGSAAADNLRSETTKEKEQKLKDCMDAASSQFGFNAADTGTDADRMAKLKEAINWVDNECMAS